MSEDFIERSQKDEKDVTIPYVKQLLERILKEHCNENFNKIEEIKCLLTT